MVRFANIRKALEKGETHEESTLWAHLIVALGGSGGGSSNPLSLRGGGIGREYKGVGATRASGP
ncbi:hypothetical protein A2943_01170 [Candidatus Adlerbacteria bacterium RIFCSPLOWO2_01_FULL_51_16]|uniref:Uncharacterized protein n=1 Tax=Candidatus Adlerbacteria bacterium RIFCSPLOWO2_01_FULL_51_16 TaxID=1797243 RepID=A0A1F4XFJ4_9BACT|nr:MAG: hypothetical protein A2943_01170 [Candidatus Adlerbacteria bacterium RIFCSPLOWO2_01_FULL_51_16]